MRPRTLTTWAIALTLATLLTLVAPAAASTTGGPSDTPNPTESSTPHERGTAAARRLLRLLPDAAAVGSDPTDDGFITGTPLVCLQLGTGPDIVVGVSRVYRVDDAFVQVFIQAYRGADTAREAFRAQRRDLLELCDGFEFGGTRASYQPAAAVLRRFGDQRFGFRVDKESVREGFVPQVGLEGAYRVGRHLVFYQAFEPSVDSDEPATGRATLRRILGIVRTRMAALPG